MIAYDVKSRRTEAFQRQNLEAENLRLRSAWKSGFAPKTSSAIPTRCATCI